MSCFYYRDNQLFAEEVAVAELAETYGTPLYIYCRSAIEAQFDAYAAGFGDYPGLICYAVKANSNLGVLSVLAKRGAGFDIVSVGELERVLLAGGQPDKIVFSGVAKTSAEMVRALEVGIRCFNVESVGELERLSRVAGELAKVAAVSLRVNPDVDAQTHPYISTGLRENKFGIDFRRASEFYQRAAALPNIKIVGLDCHIGSQLLDLQPFHKALDCLLALVEDLRAEGVPLQHLDMGGGIGVRYESSESAPDIRRYVAQLVARLRGHDLALVLEPGRSIVAAAGALVTEVEYVKSNGDHHFALVNAGMNDLIRPALYQAWMEIVPVLEQSRGQRQRWNIVGPVCESADFLGKDRLLTLQAGDLLAVKAAGAYSFVMASNYNSRVRPPEIMVQGSKHRVVRQREQMADLWALEATVD